MHQHTKEWGSGFLPSWGHRSIHSSKAEEGSWAGAGSEPHGRGRHTAETAARTRGGGCCSLPRSEQSLKRRPQATSHKDCRESSRASAVDVDPVVPQLTALLLCVTAVSAGALGVADLRGPCPCCTNLPAAPALLGPGSHLPEVQLIVVDGVQLCSIARLFGGCEAFGARRWGVPSSLSGTGLQCGSRPHSCPHCFQPCPCAAAAAWSYRGHLGGCGSMGQLCTYLMVLLCLHCQ